MTSDALLDDLLQGGRKGKGQRAASSHSSRAANLHVAARQPKSLGELYLTAKKLPQSIAKVTGYGKGRRHVLNHLSYISRGGALSLEDQDGTLLSHGIRDQHDLIKNWSSDFGDRINSRDTLHLMVSAPQSSNPTALKKAATSFLKETFAGNHSYVFALHTDTNKPHVHVCVKMMNEEGTKLNPRKALLETWRADFAKACRKQGIMVEASRRFERGLYGKPVKDAVRHLQKRAASKKEAANEAAISSKIGPQSTSEKPKHSQHAVNEKKAKHSARNQVIRRRYIEAARKAASAAKQFATEQKETLIDIAKTLDEFAKTMPVHDVNLEESYREYLNIKNEQEFEKTDIQSERQIDNELEIGD